MNISQIRYMASQGDMSTAALRYLVDCHGECEHLDFKEALHLDNDHECACLSRDIIGMKNVGGGYIVVGVRDKTWEPLGLSERMNADTKLLRDKARKCTGLDIEVDIVQHELTIGSSVKLFAIILVRSSTKRSKLRTPSMCNTNFHHDKNWGIRIGDIYVRDGDSTKRVSSDTDLQRLLDDLEARHQEDNLAQVNAMPSPFAVESGLYRLLQREYGTFVGREQYKQKLRQAVEADPRIWIINLHGPGGVGKSALATWLAYEYYSQQAFEAILHLSAKDLELSTDAGIRHLNPTLVSLEDFLDRVLHLFEHEEFCKADLQKRKDVVTEILSAYKTLLILDNMETVNDGRIMEFVRALPPGSETKILLTSRRRTSEWEYPIQVSELDEHEIQDFVRIRCRELNLDLPLDTPDVIKQIAITSGGLPLAIQWTLGEYAKTHDLQSILTRAVDPDSPLLEFSFRNSWRALDEPARQALSVLSIFDEPPTAQYWRTALDWSVEKMEKASTSLMEVTFVNERTEQKTGLKIYHALPITLTFARNELAKMGDLERKARLRYQEFRNKMDLASVETAQYTDLFNRFGAKTDLEKKAIMLCRMAEGQAKSLGYESAHQYYKQALEIDPRSVYALVSYGLFKLELGNIGEAEHLIREATKRCTKKTGYYVYFNLARVYEQTRKRDERASCLRKALEYEPHHTIARHSLGVALSQNGNFDEALQIFDRIIAEETSKPGGARDSLVYAMKTKVITLHRAGRFVEASRVLEDAIKTVKQQSEIRHLVYQLEDLKDEDFTMSTK